MLQKLIKTTEILEQTYKKAAQAFNLQADNFSYISGGASKFSKPWPTFVYKGRKYLIKTLSKLTRLEDALYCMDYVHHLKEKGLPITCISKTANPTSGDDYIYEHHHDYYTVERWADGLDISNCNATKKHFHNIGKLLATMHFAAQDFSTEHYKSTRNISLAAMLRMLDELPYEIFETLSEKEIEYLRNETNRLKIIDVSPFLQAHIPRDLNFGNLKFNETGEVKWVFDWDETCHGFRLEDLYASVLHTGRKNEGLFFPDDVISRAYIPLIEGYDMQALSLGYPPLTLTELKFLADYYDINSITYLPLTDKKNHKDILQFMHRSKQIFADKVWKDYLSGYAY